MALTSSTMTLALYEKYLAAFEAKPPDGRMMHYHWSNLAGPLSARWMAYGQMLQEFSQELANTINKLTLYVPRLQAWAEVVAPLSDEDKMWVNLEFTEPLATVAIGLPYVIQSRFAFAAAHLCHQANQAKQGNAWRDNLRLDRKIVMADAEKAGAGWDKFKCFKICLGEINGTAFREATHDFRHVYHHRFPPQFVFGTSRIVARAVDSARKQVTYVFGGTEPLSLGSVATLLMAERDYCYAAFQAFQALVAEHEAAITTTR
jgi:hypothetical protein